VIRNFLEGYRVAARAARILSRGPMAEKELTDRALHIGEQMFLGGEIERSEAVSRPVLENALAAFVEQGYLQTESGVRVRGSLQRRAAGKLALAESFLSDEAAQAIEGRIAAYLLRRPGDAGW
jgi:glycerol-3-phosphate O-acyltransferase